MKNIKNTLLAGAVAFGLASSASATTYLRLLGGNSDADAVHNSILNVLTNTTVYSGNSLTSYAYETAALKGSKNAIFSGNISGVGAVIIKTRFAGGEQGIQATVQGYTAKFLNDTNLPVSASTSGLTSANETDISAPDATTSQTFQATSRFAAGATVNQTNGAVTYSALTPWDGTNGITGATPFVFVATSDAPFTNLTTRQAQDLWSGGKVKLSAFTGNVADTNKFVYATGRDIDSAARLVANLTIGFSANGQVKQYQPSTSANVQITSAATANGATNNKLVAFPAGTIDNVAVAVFNNGYSSGGSVAKALASSATNYGGTAGVAAIIGYVGAPDAGLQSTNAVNPLKVLSFDGVALGDPNGDYNTNAAVLNGLYPFWSYQHVYYKPGLAAGSVSIVTAIAQDLLNYNSPILLSNLKVSRSGDGGVITY